MISTSPNRRRFLMGMGGLAAGAVGVAAWPVSRAPGTSASPEERDAASPVPARRPNFIVVLADDLGYGQLGCYGQQKIRTPRIDQLAAEGLRFTHAYAAAPVCAPARASLFTGLHSGHAPVRRNPPQGQDLPLQGVPTFATLLRESGYRTGLFGKWGFGPDQAGPEHPNAYGFEEFFGYLTHRSAHYYYPRALWHNEELVPVPGNQGESGMLFGPDLVMRRALDFLREPGREPFLLTLTLPLPHAPSAAPRLGEYSGLGWDPEDAAHAAQITLLDTYVGTLVDELRTQGLDENTVVLFTSDNGPHQERGVHPDFFQAAGPFRGLKRNLYEGGIRVPFIAWAPGMFRRTAGTTVEHPTAHYDLLTTLADFAEVPPPAATDGFSLRPVFTGEDEVSVHPYLYWLRLHVGSTPAHRAEEDERGLNVSAAVRFDRWKLIGWGPGTDYSRPGPDWTYELYDLFDDPWESEDVASRHPDVVERGSAHMREAWVPPGLTPQRPVTGAPA